MNLESKQVRTYAGTPPASAFASKFGTPLVIDIDSGNGYFIDSNGDVALLSGGSGYAQGTSFPVSPSVDAKFYRTDRNILYYYDGTRWLSVSQYSIIFSPYAALGSSAMGATANVRVQGWKPCAAGTDFYVEKCIINGSVSTTNNGTNYWRMDFIADTGSGTSTISSPNTGAQPWPANGYGVTETSPNALLGTSMKALYVNCVKVLSPGSLNLYTAQMVGRLVG